MNVQENKSNAVNLLQSYGLKISFNDLFLKAQISEFGNALIEALQSNETQIVDKFIKVISE